MPKIVLDMADLYDTREAAKLLNIGYVTVYRWIKSGKLTPIRISGRTLIPKSEIERINEKATGGEPVA